MKKSIQKLFYKLQENTGNDTADGFAVLKKLRGGYYPLDSTNATTVCDNDTTCSGSNAIKCNNLGTCSDTTNNGTCSNSGTCFS
jgi:hypothetical protein